MHATIHSLRRGPLCQSMRGSLRLAPIIDVVHANCPKFNSEFAVAHLHDNFDDVIWSDEQLFSWKLITTFAIEKREQTPVLSLDQNTRSNCTFGPESAKKDLQQLAYLKELWMLPYLAFLLFF